MADDPADKKDEITAEEIAELKRGKAEAESAASELRTQIEQLQSTFTNPETLKQIASMYSPQTDPGQTNPASLDPSSFIDDEDRLDVRRLAATLKEQVKKEVSGESQKAIQGLKQQIDYLGALLQVADAKTQYPDFDQYRDAITALSRKLPGATAEQLYLLATASEAQKALKEKRAQAKKKTEEGASAATSEASTVMSEEYKDEEGKPLEGLALTRAIVERHLSKSE